jgi:hypothetical protein
LFFYFFPILGYKVPQINTDGGLGLQHHAASKGSYQLLEKSAAFIFHPACVWYPPTRLSRVINQKIKI